MALYESLTAQSTPEQIAAAYKEFTGTTGGDTKAAQEAATNYLTNLGISTPTISSAYQSYLGAAAPAAAAPVATTAAPTTPAYFNANPDVAAAYAQNSYGMTPDQFAQTHYDQYGSKEFRAAPTAVSQTPLYTTLTAQSTPEQIAAAYNQAVSGAGGDTAFNQKAAIDYLTKLGVATPTVQTAYDQYKSDYASGIADKLSSAFGGTNPQLSGILSGFEAMNRGDFTEDQARRLLGTDTFDKYQSMFGEQVKTGLGEMLADKQLSGQESIDAIQFARKYGIDADEFASMTGYKPELYDALQKSYDTTVNTLVDKSLEGATTLGDRIKTGLALQSKYGFSDDDLAKAADIDAKELKTYLDPVRGFGDEYKKVVEADDASGKDILSFLETAKKNQAINSVYGSNLDAMETKLKELESKWGQYGVDGYQAENVYNQINQITNAAGGKNWSGSWAGGGDNAAIQTAKKLVEKGVDNLSDLKVKDAYTSAKADAEFYEGQQVRKDEDGRRYIVVQDPNADYLSVKYVPPGAETVPGKATTVGAGDNSYVTYSPITEDELKSYDPKTGEYTYKSGYDLVDGSSGKKIASSADKNFAIDRYSTGNFFKSTDKTMGIMMTDQGVPVPYQTSEKGGLVTSPVFPILASALLPGVATALSGALAGTVGTGLMNTALTQGIMSGGMAALTDGDIGKGFLSGAISAPISAGISSLLPSGMDPNLAKFTANAGANLVKGAITGAPANLEGSLINAGLQYGAGQLPWNLTPQQVNLLAGVATPLLQGQNISPTQLTGILANYAMKGQQAQKGAR